MLVALLKAYPHIKVTALVRKPAHVEAVQRLGVEVVQGSFSDVDLITKHARAADITVNQGSSDDVPLTNAILAGHKARVEEDKKAPAILLHTSGIGVFMDEGKEGKHDPNGKVWNVRPCCRCFLGLILYEKLMSPEQDGDEADIRAITPQRWHGPVDVPYVLLCDLVCACTHACTSLLARILRASEEGYTESYIICPGGIVGPATGPVPSVSAFFPFMTQIVLGFKKAIYVGDGDNLLYLVRTPSVSPSSHRRGQC